MLTTGGRIKAIVEERNMNLHQLAVRSGVPYNTVYSIVSRDAKTVKWDTLEKLAAALNTTPVYLQGWESDPSPVLDPEIRNTFIERCKLLDKLEPSEILTRSGDENYFKKFINGEKTPTELDLFDVATDYDLSLAYLIGMSEDIHNTTNFDNHIGDPVDNALIALHIRKIMQEDLHIKCYVQDADKITGLLLDIIGKNSIIPLAWSVDAMDFDERHQMVLWLTVILNELYTKDGMKNRADLIASEVKRESKNPPQDQEDPKAE